MGFIRCICAGKNNSTHSQYIQRSFSFWKQCLINIRNNAQCIFIINLPQNIIWQVYTIHGPESMIFFMIRKVLIVCLQHTEISSILLGCPTILTKQYPVLVFDKKLFGYAWLPS